MKILTKAVFIFLVSGFLFGQSKLQTTNKLPVIKASSEKVSIRNGNDFRESMWTIVPEYKPDIYHSSKIGEKVTFYTNLDSISVVMDTTTEFNFIILLNEKDTAYTQIKYKESDLIILKKAYLYDETQNREIPQFTYLDSSDANLKRIRKAFNLDSLAGKGNETSRLLNIMHWVHNIVRHDGSSRNPELKNAIDLVKLCKAEKRGVNCRMMAVILNECYLAMGYKSRMVTCMPKPLEFNDCHVINTVYSQNLKKWIWLDPTFDAYVMNEKGDLLGIQEVRERLINGKPLILNPEANWNRESSQTKEHYLYEYMAKNLYRLSTPLHSTYNLETFEEGKSLEYIELLPLDGINQKPIIKILENKKYNVSQKTYITNNPKQFWEEKK